MKLVDDEIRKMENETQEGSVAAEAITAEMSMKMFENSPLRSFRNFNNMTEEQLENLMDSLKKALSS